MPYRSANLMKFPSVGVNRLDFTAAAPCLLSGARNDDGIGTGIGTERVSTRPDKPGYCCLTVKKKARQTGLKVTMPYQSVCSKVVL